MFTTIPALLVVALSYCSTTQAAALTKDRVISRADFACPADSGVFPDPEDVTKFYICGGGYAILVPCPALTVFNPDQLTCELENPVTLSTRRNRARQPAFGCPEGGLLPNPKNAGCVIPATKSVVAPRADFECPALFGAFANPDDKTKYFECIASFPWLRSCPEGLLFDSALSACAKPVPTSSASPSATPSPSTEPSDTETEPSDTETE